MVNTRNILISLYSENRVNRKILWLTDSQILTCVNHDRLAKTLNLHHTVITAQAGIQ